MNKKVLFGAEAQEQLLKGVNIISNAVKATLGPKGRNVLIEDHMNRVHLTKDGVTVASSLLLEDAEQNIGVKVIKQASIKTASTAGDGTTTSIVLAQAMVQEGFKLVNSGANPIDLKRGMEASVAFVVEKLDELTQPIKNDWDKVKQVAIISANTDHEIGTLITEALIEVGDEGIIALEESKISKSYIELSTGTEWDRGYISPHFTNQGNKCVMENPYILIYDKKVRSTNDLKEIVEQVHMKKRSLLIICEELEAQALTFLIHNKINVGLKVCAVKVPSFGRNRSDMLEDLAILTDGVSFSEEKNLPLSEARLGDLGTCAKVIVTQSSISFLEGNGDKEEISDRIHEIKADIQNEEQEYMKSVKKERLAKFVGKVAKIYVGGTTDIEIKEKKDRFDDALQATRAAIKEGILPGGGYTLAKCAGELDKQEFLEHTSYDTTLGVQVIKKALSAPFKCSICSNSTTYD